MKTLFLLSLSLLSVFTANAGNEDYIAFSFGGAIPLGKYKRSNEIVSDFEKSPGSADMGFCIKADMTIYKKQTIGFFVDLSVIHNSFDKKAYLDYLLSFKVGDPYSTEVFSSPYQHYVLLFGPAFNILHKKIIMGLKPGIGLSNSNFPIDYVKHISPDKSITLVEPYETPGKRKSGIAIGLSMPITYKYNDCIDLMCIP